MGGVRTRIGGTAMIGFLLTVILIIVVLQLLF
jgi:hypothetical protein